MQHGRATDADDAAPAAPMRIYANDLAASFSLSEIELRLGQRFGADLPIAVHTFIVTSPVHLVTFNRVLSRTIAAYEGRYGAIAAPPDAAG